jgi:DNA-binding transcriptional LysR family regulator
MDGRGFVSHGLLRCRRPASPLAAAGCLRHPTIRLYLAHMAKFDIELFTIFEEIYKTGSTTRAGENLGLAQPTISIALNKLRQHFGDILFSRTSRGMEPTPYAQELINEVRAVTSAMQSVMQRRQTFDAEKSKRTFRISMTDVSEVVLLPALLNYLKHEAPMVHIDVSKITTTTHKLLENGELDLAMGYLPHLEAGFYQQTLYEHNFVCIIALDHPRIGSAMTRKDFISEGHVLVKNSRLGHSIVEKKLTESDLRRKIVLSIPSYMSAASIVANSEHMSIVPERFGQMMAKKEKIRVLPPPVALPNFSVKQHWHERFHSDPGNKWIRQALHACSAF